SRNLRKELSKSQKWYFCDNGIRNILINNINGLNLRNDIGQLWENYLVSERIKFQSYTSMLVSNFFWRTYQKQEIDWVEEREEISMLMKLNGMQEKKSQCQLHGKKLTRILTMRLLIRTTISTG
ncbi:MAG: DUF4143 domain-containing protein, partial [Bacteroidetes bacterium]|nr:DUF4143 domain-containing protein [Bacteroidota bacterium]